jgi:ribose transport system substrate-binding protein
MRNTNRRRVALVAGAVAMIVAAAMAMTAGAAANKTVNIAYFAPLANTYVQAEIVGINKVLAKNKGVKLTKFDSGFDATKQFNQVQDAITQKKFDGFILLPLDSVGLVPAAQQAISAGIKVVSLDTPLGPLQTTNKVQVKGASGSVFDPWTLRATWAVQLITKACRGLDTCNVAWMGSVQSLPSEKAYHDATLAGLKKISSVKIKIIADVDGGAYTAAGGQKVSQDLITAHPDMNVLVANGDQPAAGAVLSLEGAGVLDKVKLIGGCPSKISKPLLESGKEWGTWACTPEDEGRLAAELVIKAINGTLKAPVGLSPTLEHMKIEKIPLLITKENIDKAAIQYAG